MVYGLLMKQRKLEIRVKVDWILSLSFRPKDWLHDSFYLALGGQIQPSCNMSALSPYQLAMTILSLQPTTPIRILHSLMEDFRSIG